MKVTLNFGFFGVLTLIFVVMKCLGAIEWSWLLVFSPLVIEFIIFGVLLIMSWWSD